jgi:hypothetical protein
VLLGKLDQSFGKKRIIGVPPNSRLIFPKVAERYSGCDHTTISEFLLFTVYVFIYGEIWWPALLLAHAVDPTDVPTLVLSVVHKTGRSTDGLSR